MAFASERSADTNVASVERGNSFTSAEKIAGAIRVHCRLVVGISQLAEIGSPPGRAKPRGRCVGLVIECATAQPTEKQESRDDQRRDYNDDDQSSSTRASLAALTVSATAP